MLTELEVALLWGIFWLNYFCCEDFINIEFMVSVMDWLLIAVAKEMLWLLERPLSLVLGFQMGR